MVPSWAPAIHTASHSRPLAACRVVTVTPSGDGAASSTARRSSSATKRPSAAGPSASAWGANSRLSACTAASDSQRSRTAPRPAGGSASRNPIAASTSPTCSGSGPLPGAFAAPRSRVSVSLTSGREKNRSPDATV